MKRQTKLDETASLTLKQRLREGLLITSSAFALFYCSRSGHTIPMTPSLIQLISRVILGIP
ncbi:hypothetical protein [Rickettsiella massiliensis]|uniref:hypothetical protein n=1 Tax=Rickettsiella massiliensis TaxID=676517 RepID=UPI00029B5566|nr:hypothetical protein [Rickettsiella massiliensis]